MGSRSRHPHEKDSSNSKQNTPRHDERTLAQRVCGGVAPRNKIPSDHLSLCQPPGNTPSGKSSSSRVLTLALKAERPLPSSPDNLVSKPSPFPEFSAVWKLGSSFLSPQAKSLQTSEEELSWEGRGDIKIMAMPGSSFTPTPLDHEDILEVKHPPRVNALQAETTILKQDDAILASLAYLDQSEKFSSEVLRF
ncbi:hypothetical protein TNCV_1249181 [Trichonephila clavipes]|nr:hypothetical protein TNCV_1249181 [Trichonephila clavipes]